MVIHILISSKKSMDCGSIRDFGIFLSLYKMGNAYNKWILEKKC